MHHSYIVIIKLIIRQPKRTYLKSSSAHNRTHALDHPLALLPFINQRALDIGLAIDGPRPGPSKAAASPSDHFNCFALASFRGVSGLAGSRSTS